MKNITQIINKVAIGATLFGASLFVQSCVNEKDYSSTNDIVYPQPTIETISLEEKSPIGIPFEVKGVNLKNPAVMVGNVNCADVASDGSTITATLPRIFDKAAVRVVNVYNQEVATTKTIEPIYPETSVTEWPAAIVRGQVFQIVGKNVDLIKEVEIAGQKIVVRGTIADTASVTVLAPGDLPDEVTIKASSYAGNNIPTSGTIFVSDPSDYIDPAESVVLWDFEDGVNPYINGDITPTTGINGGIGISKGRGNNYLTIRENNVPDPWGTELGTMAYDKEIDLVEFTDPHLTFMINTEDSKGYFQLIVEQDGVQGGAHFKGGITGNDEDNYVFRATEGKWQWISVRLTDFAYEDWWGNGELKLNPKGKIQKITFSNKQGNGANPFILNLDDVMITDGPLKIHHKFDDFEDGTHDYSGSATGSINGGDMAAAQGDKYFHATKPAVASWDWTGTLAFAEATNINLAETNDPHISFWVNTGANKGNCQFEIFQNETKFGADIDKENYYVKTDGAWKLYSIRLKDLGWGNWGGDAAAPDFQGTLDYFYFGLSTGNIDGETYEIAIDDVMITDGSMF